MIGTRLIANYTVIVNGEDVVCVLHKDATVRDLITHALAKSRNLSRPVSDWTLRDMTGKAWDEKALVTELPAGEKTFLSLQFATCACPLHVGGDGSVMERQATTYHSLVPVEKVLDSLRDPAVLLASAREILTRLAATEHRKGCERTPCWVCTCHVEHAKQALRILGRQKND